jgi:5-methylcytosine-specific restriction endonuclease McrA
MSILTQKKCTKCGEWKDKYEFNERKGKGRSGLLTQCKSCVAAWHHNHQKEHPEKSRVTALRWRNKHLDEARQKWHEFIATKPAGWDAERKRQQYLEKHEKELEQARVKNSKRRAHILGNGGVITKEEWNWLKEFYSFTCLRCGKREPEIKLTLDHILPLSMGGKNVIENAQPLCQPCNSSKHNKCIDYRKERTLL